MKIDVNHFCISMFHLAFFNSIIDKHQHMYFSIPSLVVELGFLIYTESGGIGCSLRVLLFASFDLDIDVSRLQLTVSADFIEPDGHICFQ